MYILLKLCFKKIKNNIVNIDNKYLKSSIINLYLKLKYFFKIKQIYISIEKTSFFEKKKT